MNSLLPRSVGLLLGLCCVLPVAQGQQQDDPLILDDNVTFDPDADFGFDDDIFGGAFDEDGDTQEESWLDNLTVRISQQLSAQVNNHRIDFGALGSLPKESEIENSRLQFNFRYQDAFAPGWLLQASAWYRLYWDQDYMAPSSNSDNNTEGQLNELFVQYSSGAHSFKFGNQTVVWGEMIGNSVLDIINHTEFRDFTIIDIEDARLNQPMLIWDYFGDDNSSSFSSFINFYPEFNPAPVRGSPLFFDPGFNLPDYDRSGKVLLEAGTQWKKSFEGSDIALMAAYLYENQLRYDLPAVIDTPRPDGIPDINDFLLLGFSANRAIGRLLLNFDLAYSHNVLANSFAFPGANALSTPASVRKDRIGTSFGFEYAINNEQNLSLGIQAQKLLDAEEDLPPGQSAADDSVFGNWLVRYSNSLRNGDLVLSSTLQGDIEGDSLLALLGVDFTLDDNWAVNGQIISIHSSSDSPLILFHEDLRVAATLTYAF